MKIRCDLHIHSALSPCGSLEMSPEAIVKKALNLGLDCISVTDHNAVYNSLSACRAAKKAGLGCIPGIEVQTEEEVHILCYFREVSSIEKFYTELYTFLPDMPNNPDYFGDQVFVDEDSEIRGFEERLLLNSVMLSVPDLVEMAKRYAGFVVPAHIESDKFGLMYNLGFLPQELSDCNLEISYNAVMNEVLKTYPLLGDYTFISNSDAHYLSDIGRAYTEYTVNSRNMEDLFTGNNTKIIRR